MPCGYAQQKLDNLKVAKELLEEGGTWKFQVYFTCDGWCWEENYFSQKPLSLCSCSNFSAQLTAVTWNRIFASIPCFGGFILDSTNYQLTSFNFDLIMVQLTWLWLISSLFLPTGKKRMKILSREGERRQLLSEQAENFKVTLKWQPEAHYLVMSSQQAALAGELCKLFSSVYSYKGMIKAILSKHYLFN